MQDVTKWPYRRIRKTEKAGTRNKVNPVIIPGKIGTVKVLPATSLYTIALGAAVLALFFTLW
jgi:hypothetical protein